jgi:hypothetical protein
MIDTTRTAGFRKAMIGTLALVMGQLGCTQDQLVLEDRGDGTETTIHHGAGNRGEGRGAAARDSGEIRGGDEPLECGASVQELTAGQHIDIGSIVISNDADNLYVTFEATDGWLLGTTHLHVGDELGDVPTSGGGHPIPGQFDHIHTLDVEDGAAGVTSDTFVIPFSTLDFAMACGTDLHVWAHAESFLPGEGGTILQQETAWGGDTEGTGSRAWYFLASYELACCEPEDGGDGGFRTQTQGGWGSECSGGNPGCYRDDHFDAAFPGGLVIGCGAGHTLTFSGSGAVEAFLPASGTAGILTQSAVDPVDSAAGVLAGQLTAATLSLGFDAADPAFSASSEPLAGLVICGTGTSCDGLAVGTVVADANLVLGGCAGLTGLSAVELNTCLAAVNENFVDGTTDAGHLCAQ